MIVIIDYGLGNLKSVIKAFQYLGHKNITITNKKEAILKAEKIVIAGVGSFAQAMNNLNKYSLVEVIKFAIKEEKKPYLGICLGLQLLFNKSKEAPNVPGLSILEGEVEKFAPQKINLKVPHMGWNQIKIKKRAPLLKNIPNNTFMYFVHSYYVIPKEVNIIATTTNYGIEFTSMIWQDNLFGVQFHPEKSQLHGLSILDAFAKL